MSKPIPFEKSLAGLEEIVKLLENGELSLDESLKKFEEGIALARRCQNDLSVAEQKIEVLSVASPKDSNEGD